MRARARARAVAAAAAAVAAAAIRPVVNAHRAIIPMVLEIPSKDVAYDAKKDPLMKRVLQMLGEDV